MIPHLARLPANSAEHMKPSVIHSCGNVSYYWVNKRRQIVLSVRLYAGRLDYKSCEFPSDAMKVDLTVDIETYIRTSASPSNWTVRAPSLLVMYYCLQCILKEGTLNKTKITENGKRLRKNWSTSHVVLTELFLLFFKDAKSFAAMVNNRPSTHWLLWP